MIMTILMMTTMVVVMILNGDIDDDNVPPTPQWSGIELWLPTTNHARTLPGHSGPMQPRLQALAPAPHSVAA